MLIEFSVANYLSIKDRQTLRMDAASISDYPERVFEAGRYKLLRSAAIYGANASGKSNILKALGTMANILLTSASQSSTAPILVQPFLLDTQTEHQPCYFELIFWLDDTQYRYGFEANQMTIHAEWLFQTKKQQEKMLFVRQYDSIEIAKEFREGKDLAERTRDNGLFLAVCDQFNGIMAHSIFNWFQQIGIISGIEHKPLREYTTAILRDNQYKTYLTSFFKGLNLGFEGVEVDAESTTRFWAIHNQYNPDTGLSYKINC